MTRCVEEYVLQNLCLYGELARPNFLFMLDGKNIPSRTNYIPNAIKYIGNTKFKS